ncbi:MAG TPA: YbhB/YbcL family Raf kinase inhibitor-like protein [Actinomycetes bacterium]|jgi:Raf kinase inhibitor-like YbhB/YbcL family protein|nr:YbhB/YbcL family Raf kinase inhibitor-like protein [Actinomycetes bacterium]
MSGITLRSPAFDDHAPIPRRHARDGANAAPALEWSEVPAGTAELAVLCEDPDAPSRTFTHWVLAGIDSATTVIGEDQTPPGAVVGTNDFGEQGYGGPQPPVGDDAHRYFFRVFAASEPLGLAPGYSGDDLRRAIQGKELASGTLVGLYQR